MSGSVSRVEGRGRTLAIGALLLAAGLLPWILAVARVRAPGIWLVFHSLCHQRVERTLLIAGAPMLVCSRCAGVFAGIALGVIAPLPRRWLGRGRALVIAAVALAIVDVVTQDLGLHPPWHPTRLATGIAMGWAASAFLMGTLRREADAISARG